MVWVQVPSPAQGFTGQELGLEADVRSNTV